MGWKLEWWMDNKWMNDKIIGWKNEWYDNWMGGGMEGRMMDGQMNIITNDKQLLHWNIVQRIIYFWNCWYKKWHPGVTTAHCCNRLRCHQPLYDWGIANLLQVCYIPEILLCPNGSLGIRGQLIAAVRTKRGRCNILERGDLDLASNSLILVCQRQLYLENDDSRSEVFKYNEAFKNVLSHYNS